MTRENGKYLVQIKFLDGTFKQVRVNSMKEIEQEYGLETIQFFIKLQEISKEELDKYRERCFL